MRRRLQMAWTLYCQNFRSIFLTMLLVWGPFDLLLSYMEFHVFREEDHFSSFKLTQVLDIFFGVIAYSTIIFLVHESLGKRETPWTTALQTGLAKWSQMWWTRILFSLIVLIGLVCLVLPGIYLALRMTLIDQVVTLEKRSGMQAIARSFALTEGRSGEAFRLMLAGLGLIVLAMLAAVGLPYLFLYLMSETSYEFAWTWLPILPASLQVSLATWIQILVTIPVFFEKVLYHWITDGVLSFVCSLIAAYLCVLFTVLYRDYHQEIPERLEPPLNPGGVSAPTIGASP